MNEASTSEAPPAVLIIDDEEGILRVIHDQLSQSFRCAKALSAEEAFLLMKGQSYRVVLTDIHLPGASGFDVCDHVLRYYPETVMLMMTGMDGGRYASQALTAGVFHLVTKPIDFSQLQMLVQDALRHQALSARLGRRREARLS
jgi:DNA-binding NtrC family response regulator